MRNLKVYTILCQKSQLSGCDTLLTSVHLDVDESRCSRRLDTCNRSVYFASPLRCCTTPTLACLFACNRSGQFSSSEISQLLILVCCSEIRHHVDIFEPLTLFWNLYSSQRMSEPWHLTGGDVCGKTTVSLIRLCYRQRMCQRLKSAI